MINDQELKILTKMEIPNSVANVNQQEASIYSP